MPENFRAGQFLIFKKMKQMLWCLYRWLVLDCLRDRYHSEGKLSLIYTLEPSFSWHSLFNLNHKQHRQCCVLDMKMFQVNTRLFSDFFSTEVYFCIEAYSFVNCLVCTQLFREEKNLMAKFSQLFIHEPGHVLTVADTWLYYWFS